MANLEGDVYEQKKYEKDDYKNLADHYNTGCHIFLFFLILLV